jgi:hypothetical protein
MRHSRIWKATRAGIVVLLLVLVFLIAQGWVAERRFLSEVKGKPAPWFELTALNGEDVRSSDYHGKPVVLAFWAVG